MLLIEEGKDYDIVDDTNLPYTLVRNLGHGHSGNVEEVRDEVTKAVFARKTIYIPASRLSKQERTRVFHNEIKIIRALGRHRHIISVFATYVTKRHFGLILQPVASDGDLEDFLAEYWNIVGELDEPNTHNTCLEAMVPVLEKSFGCLASGLAFMHDKKVRHKDVKPRNILVHQGLVLYTDFGYSFDSNEFSRSTTEGRPSFLTRKYSAPEVLNHEERNSKSDVYSLGCVFIDLLLALTLTQDPDNETSCYSESMAGIKERFQTQGISLQYSILLETINRMTDTIPTRRLCAADVAIKILTTPRLSCNDCRANFTEKSPHEITRAGKIVTCTETMTLKQKQHAEEDASKDQSKQTASEHPQIALQGPNESKKATVGDQERWNFELDQLVNGNVNARENAAYNQDRNLSGANVRKSKRYDKFSGGASLAQGEWPGTVARIEGPMESSYDDFHVWQPMHRKTSAISGIEGLEKIRGEREPHNVNSYYTTLPARYGESRDIENAYKPVASSVSHPIDQNIPLMKPFNAATRWEWSGAHQDYYWWRCDEEGVAHYIWAKQYKVLGSKVLQQHTTSGHGLSHDSLVDFSSNQHSITPRPHDLPNPHQNASISSSRPNNYEPQSRANSRFPRMTTSEASNIFQLGRLFLNPHPLADDGTHYTQMSLDVGYSREQVGKTVNIQSRPYVVVRVDREQKLVYACPVLSHDDRYRLGLMVSPSEHPVVYFSSELPLYWELWRSEQNTIEFDRVDPSAVITASSSIWFRGMFAFDWNVEAQHIGSVTQADLPRFLQYLTKVTLH